jgi:hypothetical protein
VSRAARLISFSGHTWAVKSSVESNKVWTAGPGDNYFSANTDNVWVDKEGRLHLKITKADGRWQCAEIRNLNKTGYGSYSFSLAPGFEQLDPNVVLGMFTYDDDMPPETESEIFKYTREIDIEYSRWGDLNSDNGQFVIQPYTEPGNRYRFNMLCNGQESTHRFQWYSEKIAFNVAYNDGTDVASWTYTGQNLPNLGLETCRINLWLTDPNGPTNQKGAEVVIQQVKLPNPPKLGGVLYLLLSDGLSSARTKTRIFR